MQQCAARQFENELVERLSILANRHLRPPAPERGPHSIGKFWDLGLRRQIGQAGRIFLVTSSWSNMGMQSIKIEYVVPNMEL
jgi:hypothetical protein